MYDIEYTETAVADLRQCRKHEQARILDSIDRQLRHQPAMGTRHRKLLRPNLTAVWELRVGNFRVFYDVVEQVRIVEIQRIGEKRGSVVFFRGHQGDI